MTLPLEEYVRNTRKQLQLSQWFDERPVTSQEVIDGKRRGHPAKTVLGWLREQHQFPFSYYLFTEWWAIQ